MGVGLKEEDALRVLCNFRCAPGVLTLGCSVALLEFVPWCSMGRALRKEVGKGLGPKGASSLSKARLMFPLSLRFTHK